MLDDRGGRHRGQCDIIGRNSAPQATSAVDYTAVVIRSPSSETPVCASRSSEDLSVVSSAVVSRGIPSAATVDPRQGAATTSPEAAQSGMLLDGAVAGVVGAQPGQQIRNGLRRLGELSATSADSPESRM